MRELNVAMAMINQLDVYYLQRRMGPEEIGAAGLVGCFGGKIEPKETAEDAVKREVSGETNISIEESHKLRMLDKFTVESDHQNEPVKVNTQVFEVLLPHGQTVIAKEGELVTWTEKQILENVDQLTPATKRFFQGYFE